MLFSFYGWAKWGLETLSNFPKATYWEDRPQPNCGLKVCLNFNIILLQGPSLLPVINVVMPFMRPSRIHTIYKLKLSSPQYSEPNIYFTPLWLYPFNHLHFFFALGIVIPDAISKVATFLENNLVLHLQSWFLLRCLLEIKTHLSLRIQIDFSLPAHSFISSVRASTELYSLLYPNGLIDLQ